MSTIQQLMFAYLRSIFSMTDLPGGPGHCSLRCKEIWFCSKASSLVREMFDQTICPVLKWGAFGT